MKYNILKFIKDIIAPKKCYSCQKEGYFLCSKCIVKVNRFKSFCYSCKKSSNKFEIHDECKKNIFFDKLIILAHYKDNIIKNLIKKSKFYGGKDILEDLGEYLSDSLILNENIKNKDNYIIASVPMYFLRKFKRGYNHSDIIAKYISKETGIFYDKSIIKRVKNTRQQSTLSKGQRLINIKKCFKIRKNNIDNIDKKILILVDDVVSTGATLNEISKLFKKAGVKKVVGLVIASN